MCGFLDVTNTDHTILLWYVWCVCVYVYMGLLINNNNNSIYLMHLCISLEYFIFIFLCGNGFLVYFQSVFVAKCTNYKFIKVLPKYS